MQGNLIEVTVRATVIERTFEWYVSPAQVTAAFRVNLCQSCHSDYLANRIEVTVRAGAIERTFDWYVSPAQVMAAFRVDHRQFRHAAPYLRALVKAMKSRPRPITATS